MIPPRERIERVFMAAEADREDGQLAGPYASAAEAEARASKEGWEWVAVYSHVLNEKGEVIDVQRRFYSPGRPGVGGRKAPLSPGTAEKVAKLLRFLSTPDPPPMSASEEAFFAPYERQMRVPK
jgi:hypothetical protein